RHSRRGTDPCGSATPAIHLRLWFKLVWIDPRTLMNRTLILTGGTGAIGVPLLAELLKARIFERIIVLVRTEPTKLHAALQCESPGLDTSSLETLFAELGATSATTALASLPAADCVIHGAACTQFRAPVSLLE